jgi:hypothetical protein
MVLYRKALAVTAVILFLSGLDLYFFMADQTTITPRDLVTGFACLVAPLLIFMLHRREPFVDQLKVVVLWGAAYLALSAAWLMILPSDIATQEFRDRLFSVFFMAVAAVALTSPECRRVAAGAAVVVVLGTVAINVIQMVQPDWFVMGVSTRASGLLGNANQCGAALVIGMIIAAPIIAPRLRLPFFLATGVGVALTFSRSSLVGWILASLVLTLFDSSRTRFRSLLVAGTVTLFLTVAFLQIAGASGAIRWFSLDDNQADRVSFFSTLDTSDDAAQERKQVASEAWDLFLERPLLGHGLGSTLEWNERASTHNMFLYLIADHGLIGVFILPALLAGVISRRQRADSGPYWAFCLFALWDAFFSHNLLEERYLLLGFAFFATGGVAALSRAANRAEALYPVAAASPASLGLSPIGARR